MDTIILCSIVYGSKRLEITSIPITRRLIHTMGYKEFLKKHEEALYPTREKALGIHL